MKTSNREKMTPEETNRACQAGTHASVDMLRSLGDSLGIGEEYKAAVGGAATALLFHAWQRAGNDHGTDILVAILNDVAHNLKEHHSVTLNFSLSATQKH